LRPYSKTGSSHGAAVHFEPKRETKHTKQRQKKAFITMAIMNKTSAEAGTMAMFNINDT